VPSTRSLRLLGGQVERLLDVGEAEAASVPAFGAVRMPEAVICETPLVAGDEAAAGVAGGVGETLVGHVSVFRGDSEVRKRGSACATEPLGLISSAIIKEIAGILELESLQQSGAHLSARGLTAAHQLRHIPRADPSGSGHLILIQRPSIQPAIEEALDKPQPAAGGLRIDPGTLSGAAATADRIHLPARERDRMRQALRIRPDLIDRGPSERRDTISADGAEARPAEILIIVGIALGHLPDMARSGRRLRAGLGAEAADAAAIRAAPLIQLSRERPLRRGARTISQAHLKSSLPGEGTPLFSGTPKRPRRSSESRALRVALPAVAGQ